MSRQKAASPHGRLVALAIGLTVGVLLGLTLLLIPDLLLTRLLMPTRDVRVMLATAWVGVATIAWIAIGARYGRAPGGAS